MEIYTAPSIFADVDPEMWARIVKRAKEHQAEIEALIGPENAAELERRIDHAFLYGLD
jgi:hypothetical protein